MTDDKNKTKRKLFVLVGPPAVGKSTWIKNTFSSTPFLINRDDIVEQVASELGWTYDDLFVTPPRDAKIGDVDKKYGEVVKAPRHMRWTPTAFSRVVSANNEIEKRFRDRVAQANQSNKDIVIDMTNMTPKTRRRALSMFKGDFEKIAVVFEFKGIEDIIRKVAQKRAAVAKRMGKSKTIPKSVLQSMMDRFVPPSKAEGFDKIISVDNKKALEKYANEPEPIDENVSPETLQDLVAYFANIAFPNHTKKEKSKKATNVGTNDSVDGPYRFVASTQPFNDDKHRKDFLKKIHVEARTNNSTQTLKEQIVKLNARFNGQVEFSTDVSHWKTLGIDSEESLVTGIKKILSCK